MSGLYRLNSSLFNKIFSYGRIAKVTGTHYEVYHHTSSTLLKSWSDSLQPTANTDTTENSTSGVEVCGLSRGLALTLFKNISREFYKEKSNEILERIEFKEVTKALEQNLHTLEAYILYDIFVFYIKKSVPCSDLFLNKLFTLLLKNINSFDGNQVLEILRKLRHSDYDKEEKTFSALMKACDMYLKSNYNPKMISPQQSFKFLTDSKVPLFVVEQMLLNILDVKENIFVHPKTFSSVFYGLNNSKFIPKEKCNEIIEKTISMLETTISNFKSSAAVLDTLNAYRRLTRIKKFNIDMRIVDIFVDKAIQDEWDLGELSYLMDVLVDFPVFSQSLYSLICKKALMYKNNSMDVSMEVIKRLLHLFSVTGFMNMNQSSKDYFINQIQLLNSSEYIHECLKTNKFFSLLHHNFQLASLGIYDKRLIDDWFDSAEKLFERSEYKGISKFYFRASLILHQWVSLFHPEHEKNLSKDFLQICFERGNWKLTVQKEIEKIFGGPDYVLTNCITSLYHNLNYVVGLDVTNEPINLSAYKNLESKAAIEEMQRQPGVRMLIIQEVPVSLSVTYKNIPMETNINEFYKNVLKKLDSEVVLLDSFTLEKYYETGSCKLLEFVLNRIEAEIGSIKTELKADIIERSNLHRPESEDDYVVK